MLLQCRFACGLSLLARSGIKQPRFQLGLAGQLRFGARFQQGAFAFAAKQPLVPVGLCAGQFLAQIGDQDILALFFLLVFEPLAIGLLVQHGTQPFQPFIGQRLALLAIGHRQRQALFRLPFLLGQGFGVSLGGRLQLSGQGVVVAAGTVQRGFQFRYLLCQSFAGLLLCQQGVLHAGQFCLCLLPGRVGIEQRRFLAGELAAQGVELGADFLSQAVCHSVSMASPSTPGQSGRRVLDDTRARNHWRQARSSLLMVVLEPVPRRSRTLTTVGQVPSATSCWAVARMREAISLEGMAGRVMAGAEDGIGMNELYVI